jgi:hypothetical protein
MIEVASESKQAFYLLKSYNTPIRATSKKKKKKYEPIRQLQPPSALSSQILFAVHPSRFIQFRKFPKSKNRIGKSKVQMSWLARSLAASLNLPDSDQPADPVADAGTPSHLVREDRLQVVTSTATPAHGVKEDLSELSQTLSRHFKGVASFLAPPPAPSDQDPSADLDGLDSPTSDLSHRTVSGISKIASTFLQLKSEDEEEEEYEEDEEVGVSGYAGFDAIGITDEALAFARNISMHPETWLDFPLLPDEDEPDSLFFCKSLFSAPSLVP